MIEGSYARVTKLPISEAASKLLVSSLEVGFDDLRRDNKLFTILNEEYIKTTTIHPNIKLNEGEMLPVSMGSTWLLKCEQDHHFHYHTFETGDCLSYRKLLFFSSGSFTLEFFYMDHKTGEVSEQLEKFFINSASIVELEFDGRIVHRFRPVDSEKLFAYSIHVKDVNTEHDVASTQTHPVIGVMPKKEKLIEI